MELLERFAQFDFSLIVTFAAIVVMLYCLLQVITLKPRIPGGIIGKRWNFLMGLVFLFTFGYIATPFFGALPEDLLRLIVSFIFFFGALYVVVTVKLIYRIIQELTE